MSVANAGKFRPGFLERLLRFPLGLLHFRSHSPFNSRLLISDFSFVFKVIAGQRQRYREQKTVETVEWRKVFLGVPDYNLFS